MHTAPLFENNWLSRYPRLVNCIYDQGGEFTGLQFQNMLRRNNIEARPISAKNPQANSICERMHQSIDDTLRTLATLNPPAGIESANQLVDTTIATSVFALRSTVHSALQTTPGGLVFGRDMILDIPLVSDLETIQQKRRQLINDSLIIANRQRFSHDYHIGNEVLKLTYKPNKFDPKATGTYIIEQVHTNGTVTI